MEGALNLNLLGTRDECKQYYNKLSFTIKICQYLVFFTIRFGQPGHLRVMQKKKKLIVTLSSIKRRNESSILCRMH